MNRMASKKKADIEESGGNVFEDLGCENPDERLVKAHLGLCISRIVEDRGWKQQEAAEHIGAGLDQPKVSKLLRGQLREFSIERLLVFLRALGWDVDIVLKEAKEPSSAMLRVVERASAS